MNKEIKERIDKFTSITTAQINTAFLAAKNLGIDLSISYERSHSSASCHTGSSGLSGHLQTHKRIDFIIIL